MTEGELRAAILAMLEGVYDDDNRLCPESAIQPIMDMIAEYASDRADDAAYNAMPDAGEHDF